MMQKSLILYSFLIYYLYQRYVSAQEGHRTYKYMNGPHKVVSWPLWPTQIANVRVTNLTAELLRDMHLKLEQAKTIQEQYRFSVTFELGTIAASVSGFFKHMLEVYRMYSKMDDFIYRKYSLHQVIDAYHIIQGDYHQIRYERGVFYEMLEKHKRAQADAEKKRQEEMTEDKIAADMWDKYKKQPRRAFNETGLLDSLQENKGSTGPFGKNAELSTTPAGNKAKRRWVYKPKWAKDAGAGSLET